MEAGPSHLVQDAVYDWMKLWMERGTPPPQARRSSLSSITPRPQARGCSSFRGGRARRARARAGRNPARPVCCSHRHEYRFEAQYAARELPEPRLVCRIRCGDAGSPLSHQSKVRRRGQSNHRRKPESGIHHQRRCSTNEERCRAMESPCQPINRGQTGRSPFVIATP